MTTTRPRRFSAKAAEDTAAQKDKWVVTWWQLGANNTLELCSSAHDTPGDARIKYMNCEHGSDAGMWHWTFDAERDRWNVENVIVTEVSPVEQANINRKGLAVVRAVLAHRGGTDARGQLLVGRRLDDELADDSPARRRTQRPVPEPLTSDDPAECVVCDYAMEHGLAADHLCVPRRPVQTRTHEPF